MIVLRVLLGLAGIGLVGVVVSSAVRSVVVPRGEVVLLTRYVFQVVRLFFMPFAKDAHTYERRDRVMARYAPTALMVLPLAWAAGVMAGFTLVFYAIDHAGWQDAIVSGSSITTLGFETVDGTGARFLMILEALLGLGLVALLISFLPAIYAQFSRREVTVSKLYMRAEDADGIARPSALIRRSHEIGGLDQLQALWEEWEHWFVEIGEAHTSFASLNFFRSPSPDRSWVTGAGLALDAASIYLAAVNVTRHPRASLMIRSGYVALRNIADFFDIGYDPDPRPDDPISVTREEFFEVYVALAAAGVPVRPNRERAWRDYQGWRVNYDEALTRLAGLTMAPYAPWVSDRSVRYQRPPLRRSDRRRRRRSASQRPS
jgi:hypothetical protein